MLSACTNELGRILKGTESLRSELFDVNKGGTKPAMLAIQMHAVNLSINITSHWRVSVGGDPAYANGRGTSILTYEIP